MSQMDLAKAVKMTVWDISRAESHRLNLTDDEQYWIRVALNWPPSVDAVLDVIEQATFGPEANGQSIRTKDTRR